MWNVKKESEKIVELEKEIMKLKGCIRKQNESDDNDMSSSEFEMDFEALEAFSIERMLEHGKPITTIGFVRRKDKKDGLVTGHWIFYCSVEEHNKLVKKFREYLKAKKEK